jgi:hypothetical protein
MGFNKKHITFEVSFQHLKEKNLDKYYGKNDMLLFEDNDSLLIYELFSQGKTNEEILLTIKKNMEENK